MAGNLACFLTSILFFLFAISRFFFIARKKIRLRVYADVCIPVQIY